MGNNGGSHAGAVQRLQAHSRASGDERIRGRRKGGKDLPLRPENGAFGNRGACRAGKSLAPFLLNCVDLYLDAASVHAVGRGDGDRLAVLEDSKASPQLEL